jgi:mRNA interferase MazF
VARQTYFPDRGDFVHLNFSPSARHEIVDRHFAIVLSTRDFARVTGFSLVCPITSNTTSWPFDVAVPPGHLPQKQGKAIASAILTDQVKSIDFRDRECEFVGKASDDLLDDVLAKVRAIIDSDNAVEEVSAG